MQARRASRPGPFATGRTPVCQAGSRPTIFSFVAWPSPVPPEVVGGARTVPAGSGKYFKLARQDERCRIAPAALPSGTERAPAPAVTHNFGMHRAKSRTVKSSSAAFIRIRKFLFASLNFRYVHLQSLGPGKPRNNDC